jgi:DNA-binding beta-propeller fold protein YncE
MRAKVITVFVAVVMILGVGFGPFVQKSAKADGGSIQLSVIGRYDTDGAEISAYDPATKRLYVTGAGTNVAVLDLTNPAYPSLIKTLNFDATSVAVKNGIVAIAVPFPGDNTKNGQVYLYESTSSLDNPVKVEAGALPDMVTFTPDGRRILVANEGERTPAGDPEGSVSIIDVGRGIEKAQVKQATFKSYNDRRAELLAEGVRIFADAASVAQDLEPEYIAVSSDSKTAWVTLQENNSLAVLQIPAAAFKDIIPLGYKDHSLPGNALDASDRDGKINIVNWPVYGMYMPDGITAFEANGQTYLMTANEGDSRDLALEDARVNSLTLDPTVFPNAATLKQNANLGRLTVSKINGDVDGDGDYDALYAYGARSFTIWSADGAQVFDSGDDLEQMTAAQTPALFNADSGSPALFDTRSDNKGPEPEGVTTGIVNGIKYGFVGLERAGGGVVVYDMTDPANPGLVQYARSDEDVSPEGLLFVPAACSPNGKPLLVVTNEVSGTVAIYQIDTIH